MMASTEVLLIKRRHEMVAMCEGYRRFILNMIDQRKDRMKSRLIFVHTCRKEHLPTLLEYFHKTIDIKRDEDVQTSHSWLAVLETGLRHPMILLLVLPYHRSQ